MRRKKRYRENSKRREKMEKNTYPFHREFQIQFLFAEVREI